MAKKKKIGKEEFSINFKLSEELKKKIKELAQGENKTVSKYLINHFESFIDGSLFEDELDLENGIKFKFSEEFMQLIVWMYSKRVNLKCEEKRFELREFVTTLKRINNIFPAEIEAEFDKVLQNVIGVINKPSSNGEFTFARSGDDGFNFKGFENYLLKGERERIVINVGPKYS